MCRDLSHQHDASLLRREVPRFRALPPDALTVETVATQGTNPSVMVWLRRVDVTTIAQFQSTSLDTGASRRRARAEREKQTTLEIEILTPQYEPSA